jgi:hypothetical protein
MSKMIRRAALIAAILVVPTASCAQTSGALTRAEVRADLVRVEQAGYMPGNGDATNYPVGIQAAEARIGAQNDQQTNQSFGGVPMQGMSAAGSAHADAPSECVGPISFCTPFFGS